jgi:dienelactone hydrolase
MRAARRPQLFLAATLTGLLALAVSAGLAQAQDILQEPLTIPALIAGPGRSQSVDLDALVFRPNDRLPHPLAIINHGSPRNLADRAAMTPFGMSAQAQAFARRGWVAVSFLRRGYGRSQGGWADSYGACADPDYASAGRTAAEDIAAVAAYMASQPYVSKGKWISVGVSAGGFATVALTAASPPNLAAALVFAPGRGSSAVDTVCGEDRLVAAFAEYGRTSRVPLLWVSAPNDHFFGPQLVAEMTSAFRQGGANLTFVAAPPFGQDGHFLFSGRGVAIWSPIVDRFLSARGLSASAAPASEPKRVATPDGLNPGGQQAFATYLDSGPNKAFAIGESEHFGWASGRLSTEEAKRAALDFCLKGGAANCAIVNLNDDPAN